MKKLNKEWSNCHLFRSCKHVDPTTFQICWKIDPTHLKQILHIQVNNWLVNQSERSYYWHQTLTNGQLLQSTWDGKSSEKMARSALTKRWHDLKTVKLPWAQSSPQGEKQQSLDIWTRVTSLTKKKTEVLDGQTLHICRSALHKKFKVPVLHDKMYPGTYLTSTKRVLSLN